MQAPVEPSPPQAPELRDRLQAVLRERYAVECELGRGGMGTVFLARDLKHDRPVAIKVLHPELATALGAKRFLTEIRLAANLAHPHIVPVFESGEAAGLLFYVMQYVEGESLRDRLERDGPLPVEEAVRIALDVAEALAFAHGREVVHRDIKPENILLAGHGHATVADFGVARALSTATDERLTATGLILGSPPYLSPEQADPSGVVDGRADLYSLGCVLHEILAGAPPFGNRGAQATLFSHLTEPPPPLRSLRPDVPPAVEAAVLQALAKEPGERFSSAEAFAAALDARAGAARGPRVPHWRPSPRRERRRRAPVALATGAVLALLAIPVIWLLSTSAPTIPGVVVLPFVTAGAAKSAEPGAPPDRWLASSLGLLPVVRVVDAQAVLEGAKDWRKRPVRDVATRARRRGARYLVLGSVLGERLTVEVYAVRGVRQIYTGGAVTGETHAEALDRLALEIVRSVAEAEDLDLGPLDEVASATTSLVALTEVIQGQRLFFRGETDAAVEAYRRAIAADSAFGPAYFRLSMAETWGPRWDYPAALAVAEAGLRKRDRMAPRWVDLLSALRHYARRSTDSAAVQFQKAASENPDLPDALLGLGEFLIHSGGFLGERATVALPTFRRLVAIDSAYAPIAHHIVELALYVDDERLARTYLPRILDADDARACGLAVALRFGGARERATAFDSLRVADLRTVATVVAFFAQDGLNLPLADSVARLLTLPERSPEERARGARWRLAALAGQGRWSQAIAAWDSASGRPPFDSWVIHAWLAGFPAEERAAPMFRWAEAEITRQAPSFVPLLRGEAARRDAQDALRALVHRATLQGDSAEAGRLLAIVRATAPTAAPSDPEPGALQASLNARLALLARDTTAAIIHLEQAVARLPWSTTWYMPLADGATQRLLLAELLRARGDAPAADRQLRSFGQVWLLGDAVFRARVARAREGPGSIRAGRLRDRR
ncbi:MAG TPA: protein kinase [Longimicrobium sp.]|jgi:serine/threonine-protein kinase